jgi:hypothetical protein
VKTKIKCYRDKNEGYAGIKCCDFFWAAWNK